MPVAGTDCRVIMTIGAIVTDIEGTTSSIEFVHDVLFPYASRALPDFVRRNQAVPEISAILDRARSDAGEPVANIERIIEILLAWIDEDRKASSLKELQGHIWKHGYENGDFTGHVYQDATRMLRQWAAENLPLYVYSSGSVAAQKLLFGYSDAGNLAPLFQDYFDTGVGHKTEPDSYRRIASRIALPPAAILFLSDVAKELDAAATAGMQTVQLVRDDNVVPGVHAAVSDFDGVQSILQKQQGSGS
jgi:enolase-phosphatase E1